MSSGQNGRCYEVQYAWQVSGIAGTQTQLVSASGHLIRSSLLFRQPVFTLQPIAAAFWVSFHNVCKVGKASKMKTGGSSLAHVQCSAYHRYQEGIEVNLWIWDGRGEASSTIFHQRPQGWMGWRMGLKKTWLLGHLEWHRAWWLGALVLPATCSDSFSISPVNVKLQIKRNVFLQLTEWQTKPSVSSLVVLHWHVQALSQALDRHRTDAGIAVELSSS